MTIPSQHAVVLVTAHARSSVARVTRVQVEISSSSLAARCTLHAVTVHGSLLSRYPWSLAHTLAMPRTITQHLRLPPLLQHPIDSHRLPRPLRLSLRQATVANHEAAVAAMQGAVV